MMNKNKIRKISVFLTLLVLLLFFKKNNNLLMIFYFEINFLMKQCFLM